MVQRKRPPLDKVVGLFWAPGTDGDGWHWRRDVSTWTLPVLLGALGYEYTLRELYNIWCFMPLIVQTQVRGQKNVEKNNQRLKTYSTLKEETQNFLEACGLPLKPSTQAEWKLLYREMGAFMAASSFITHTPPCIMELPPAAVRDSKQHMIERAICDERITLPLAALKDVDAVYAKLLPQLGAASMVEIKVAWRCTEEQWWVAKVTDPAKAAAIYRKLGYPDASIVGMGLPHPDAPPTGASGPDMGGALLDEHLPDSQVNYPQLTADCVESIAGTDFKKKQFKDKNSHVFWGRLECGLILSSISPWDVVTKESGVTRGGYVCKHCKGFWKSKRGSRSRAATRANEFLCSSSWMSRLKPYILAGSSLEWSTTPAWNPRPRCGMSAWTSTRTRSAASDSAGLTTWSTSPTFCGASFSPTRRWMG